MLILAFTLLLPLADVPKVPTVSTLGPSDNFYIALTSRRLRRHV